MDASTTVLLSALASAVVQGAVEGWRRAGLQGAIKSAGDELRKHAETAADDAKASTARLSLNLGPRVEGLQDRVARIEGHLGLKAPDPAEVKP